LKPSFIRQSIIRAVICAIIGVAMIAGVAWWQTNEVRHIQHDQALWARGVAALDARVSGHVTSHNAILDDYHLDVEYIDRAQTTHNLKCSLSTLFQSIDQKAPIEVHYDPNAPDDFVLSWAVDVNTGRWTYVAFMLATIGFMGVGLLVAARTSLRHLADARACAEWSDEVQLTVERVVVLRRYGRDTGARRYRLRLPATLGGRAYTYAFGKGHRPRFTDADERVVIALNATRSSRPTVVESDFHPFAVPSQSPL
jgi:hypothetical protein